MKQLIIGLVIFSILFQKSANSQTLNEKLVNYEEVIGKGTEFFDKGEYDEALKLFLQVHRSDPSYPLACYNSALTYYNQNKLDLALEKCQEALWYNTDRPSVYSLLGNILDDMGKPEEGIKTVLPALERWPYNQRLLISLAYCYLSLKEYSKAEPLLIKIIRFNPYNTKAHLLLAKTNFAMGRTAQAYYAFNMALVMNPTISNLREFENAITGNLDSLIQRFKFPYAENVDQKKWDELKAFMESELSFNKNFVLKHKVENTITHQTQMLFQKGTYDVRDTSVYNQLYVRFYQDMMDKGLFDTYIYYIFQKSGFEFVAQWNEKNKKQISEFIGWAQKNLNTWRSFAYNPELERQNVSLYHFKDNSVLSAIGRLATAPDTIKQGIWTFMNSNGGLSEKGTYVNNQIQGAYSIFWDDSKIKQLLNFKDNELDGACQTFYQDGSKSGVYDYKEGKRNGKAVGYNSSGLSVSTDNYKEGKFDGLSIGYDFKEGLLSRVNYQDGVTQGYRDREWLNGKKELEFTLRNDSVNGPYKAWHENGKIRYEGIYKNDNPNGLWTYYHWNGTLDKQGGYDSLGQFTGIWNFYYQNGKKLAVENAYINGDLNGIRTEYYLNGNISSTFDFVDDKLMKIAFNDSLGVEKYSATAINDRIEYKSIYSDGTWFSEGLLKTDKNHEGVWKFYNPYGIKVKEYNYSDGQYFGPQKTFYFNGQINEEYNCDSNKVNGLYKEYYINGNLKSTGWSTNGKNNGEWLTFYPDGKLKTKTYFIEGEIVGFYQTYSNDGTIDQEYYYGADNMVRNIRFYGKNGKIENEVQLKNGNGKILLKYSNGNPKSKITYLMGMLNDTLATYYNNGKKASEIIYLYGKANGTSKTWDVNGRLTSEANYIMGKEDGPLKVYEDGVLIRESNYEGGIETGILKYYYYNGKLSRLMNFPSGERNGYTYYYSPEGLLTYRAFFIDGAIKSYSYLDPTGKYVKEIPFTEKTKELLANFPNGKVSARITYINGEMDGKRIEYFSNGKVAREAEFKLGNYHGIYKTYYITGQVFEEVNYMWDDLNGTITTYYENGKKKSEGNYRMDSKDGLWKYYDINGLLTNVINYKNGNLAE
jgi:antitoxin component YwqK of YwqJK toxin-antitoxin module/Tfp pilus assembly protein PilF